MRCFRRDPVFFGLLTNMQDIRPHLPKPSTRVDAPTWRDTAFNILLNKQPKYEENYMNLKRKIRVISLTGLRTEEDKG